MTFDTHLPIHIEKIQSGVSRIDARKCARLVLEGSESASLDAELIVAFVCGISRLELLTSAAETLSQGEAESIRALVKRRARNEPVAHLFSEKEFYGLNFRVNSDVLIPRPDTEILVEATINLLQSVVAPRVLDVCTGSGCIAVAIAHNLKGARVIATDISKQALEIAEENAHRNGVLVDFRLGDLLEPCLAERDIDLIVANPPYILASDIPGLMPDVRDFEPHLALLGEGDDGLGLHCKIMSQSLQLLKPGGMVMLEIGMGQAEILLKTTFSGFSRVEFLTDYGGIQRVAKYVRTGVIHG